jgi:hypothetical protein
VVTPWCAHVGGLGPGGEWRGGAQGPGCCTRSRLLVATLRPGWRRHSGRAAGSPSPPAALPPFALRATPAATGGTGGALPDRMPLHTHRNSRASIQKAYAAARRTSPASAAARGAQLPLPMAFSCTHRSASSVLPSRACAAPVVASVHHSYIALVRWALALGAAHRGQCHCGGLGAARLALYCGPRQDPARAFPPLPRPCALRRGCVLCCRCCCRCRGCRFWSLPDQKLGGQSVFL